MGRAVVAILALLGVSALAAGAYAYESAQPVSITLAPFPQQPNGTYTQSSPLTRTPGKQVVLTLPSGATWVAATAIAPVTSGSSSSSSTSLQVGGSQPFTYTENATDLSIAASWTLNGVTYINVFTFN